ncbi:MAG: protein kinase [Acidobacteriota bacterium]|nr:protein kinase [Acidobacteriota bacterium]
MLANNKVLRGRYRIIQPLGHGAVYEAYDTERETNVALKEILIDLEKVSNISLREKIKHDFANQAKILAKVKHESLPQVRGYFTEVDRHYLIMELVDGTEVGEVAAKEANSAAFSEITDWSDQLLDALDYLHTLTPSIVHRDINPANVKISSRGKIKLLGFNIANGAEAETSMLVKNNSSAVAMHYLPLEQIIRVVNQTSKKKLTDNHGDRLENILKQPVDVRSDVYALGATIYYLLTKQIPVDAMERTLAIWEENSDPLPTAHQINSEIPIEISDVIAKAMGVESGSRFDSAAQMRQMLQTAVKKSKERAAEEAKNSEVAATRETFLAGEKKLEKERQLVEQERQQLEAERKQQSEQIEQQLKEAEVQRISAEQRAAEAERRLSENEKSIEKFSAAGDKSSESDHQSNSIKKSSVFPSSNSLFADAPPEKRPSRMMPVAALVFLIVGGIAAGVWFMRPSNAAESLPPVVDASALVDKVAPEMPAPQPSPVAEKSPEISVLSPNPVEPSPVAAVNQSAPKIRNVQPAPIPRLIRPTFAPSSKAPVNQKKAVTVDDLIGR